MDALEGYVKRLALLLLGDYAIYQLWRFDGRPAAAAMSVRTIQPKDLRNANPAIADAAWYFGEEAHAFGCFDGERLVGAAFYWHGRRYETRRTWSIPPGSSKLVHIVTDPDQRGRGVATALISASAAEMMGLGFRPLYAGIWHSHKASQGAFARAGWRRVGWLVRVNPLRRARPWTIRRFTENAGKNRITAWRH